LKIVFLSELRQISINFDKLFAGRKTAKWLELYKVHHQTFLIGDFLYYTNTPVHRTHQRTWSMLV